jgi:hypothetical protein
MTVYLLVNLIAREPHAFGVDHHHMIAAIEMRGVARLIFPNQKPRNTRRQTAQNLPLGVHHEPIFAYHQRFGLTAFCNVRPHLPSHTFPSKTNAKSNLDANICQREREEQWSFFRLRDIPSATAERDLSESLY